MTVAGAAGEHAAGGGREGGAGGPGDYAGAASGMESRSGHDAAVEFDPFSEEFFGDPTELYRRLRDECPVFHSARYGFWALSRYADVVAAHRDWESLTSTHGVDLVMLGSGRPAPEPRSLIMLDPPEHNRMRALVSREFSPRAVATLEPMVREVARAFFDSLEGRDSFDAVVDLAGPLPVEVI